MTASLRQSARVLAATMQEGRQAYDSGPSLAELEARAAQARSDFAAVRDGPMSDEWCRLWRERGLAEYAADARRICLAAIPTPQKESGRV